MEPQSDLPALPEAPESPASPPRSRRAVLAAAVGGLAGSLAAALGRPAETRAAPGDQLIIGQTNFAGGAGTRLNATSSGGAFWATQYGFGSGVRGDSVSGYGGVFTTQHASRFGLLAQHTGSTGVGGGIRADGAGGFGVWATGTSGGVRGESNQSTGVFGNGGTAGVYGKSETGTGVHATSVSGYGLYATSGSSYAGYFAGALHVTGMLSKGGGAFRIDHPLDPANKLLQHSFVESPDMKNVYDGLVTTDASGEATVELPDWFDALNRDIRYQLTTIGSPARAWIAEEAKANRFAIRTDEPDTKVSWQLTGIRRDAWAEAHRIEVELDKAGDKKGKYLHPVERGQPASKGVDFEE